jgi:hypothetical protein
VAAPSSSAVPSSSSGEPAPLDFSAPLHLSADALGLGDRNVFLGRVPDAPSAAPLAPDGTPNVAPGVQQSIRDALGERDHAIGLDLGGPLIGVAETVTRASETPADSRAVFEVTADATGRITNVRLVDASAGSGAWERVGARFAGALQSQRLAMRGHRGAVITVAVVSRWRLPSGSRPRQPIGNTEAADPLTGDGCKIRGSGCYSSNSFDVTDLAAKPARQVQASVLSERHL